ncbi:MAG: CinA family protein [Bacilli bacterium]|nr:CinA family protein [Bacilli bacterium]
MQKVVERLKELNLHIATMESCTGGGVANAITNVPGASEVLLFSAVTYSNEYKIKMGVNSETIDKYSVYSMEVAREMSKSISDFAHSDIGVGVTGKMGVLDPANPYGDDNTIYVSIYKKDDDTYHTFKMNTKYEERKDNKELIIERIQDVLLTLLD